MKLTLKNIIILLSLMFVAGTLLVNSIKAQTNYRSTPGVTCLSEEDPNVPSEPNEPAGAE